MPRMRLLRNCERAMGRRWGSRFFTTEDRERTKKKEINRGFAPVTRIKNAIRQS